LSSIIAAKQRKKQKISGGLFKWNKKNGKAVTASPSSLRLWKTCHPQLGAAGAVSGKGWWRRRELKEVEISPSCAEAHGH
jgi:hypothetical protein